MCGRYYIDSAMENEIEKVVHDIDRRIHQDRFLSDIRPTDVAPVIEMSNQRLKLNTSRWGIAITILQDKGLLVDRVEDGVQCVAKMEQEPAGSYDLILMDIQMPNMDGYSATQKIRSMEDREKANIPIVAITANAFDEDKQKAFSVGMNEHIAKPIDVERVIKY